MTLNPLERVFVFEDQRLADPSARMSPADVKTHYANLYPELASAKLTGPEYKDGQETYTFKAEAEIKG